MIASRIFCGLRNMPANCSAGTAADSLGTAAVSVCLPESVPTEWSKTCERWDCMAASACTTSLPCTTRSLSMRWSSGSENEGARVRGLPAARAFSAAARSSCRACDVSGLRCGAGGRGGWFRGGVRVCPAVPRCCAARRRNSLTSSSTRCLSAGGGGGFARACWRALACLAAADSPPNSRLRA